jgi:hypothetical protein
VLSGGLHLVSIIQYKEFKEWSSIAYGGLCQANATIIGTIISTIMSAVTGLTMADKAGVAFGCKAQSIDATDSNREHNGGEWRKRA